MRIGRLLCTAVGLAGCASVCGTAIGQEASSDRTGRGEYIAKHVAMCVQCHTPRDDQGRLIESELFNGAKIPIPSPFPDQDWAFDAPPLAGLPALQMGDVVVLLSTGKRASGESPRPPMPSFRMTPEDATAVTEYLQSLPLPHR